MNIAVKHFLENFIFKITDNLPKVNKKVNLFLKMKNFKRKCYSEFVER